MVMCCFQPYRASFELLFSPHLQGAPACRCHFGLAGCRRRLPQQMGQADGRRVRAPAPAGHGAPAADAESLEHVLSPQQGGGLRGDLFFWVAFSSHPPQPPDSTACAWGETAAQRPPQNGKSAPEPSLLNSFFPPEPQVHPATAVTIRCVPKCLSAP